MVGLHTQGPDKKNMQEHMVVELMPQQGHDWDWIAEALGRAAGGPNLVQTMPDDPCQHSASWIEDAFRVCTQVAREEVPHGVPNNTRLPVVCTQVARAAVPHYVPQTTATLPFGRGFEGLSARMGTRKRRRMALYFTLWRVNKWLREVPPSAPRRGDLHWGNRQHFPT